MEIYTDNIVTFTVSHERLHHNFLAIDSALKALTQRIQCMAKTQDGIGQIVDGHELLIRELKIEVQGQGEKIRMYGGFEDINEEEIAPEQSSTKRNQEKQISKYAGLENGTEQVQALPPAASLDSLESSKVSPQQPKLSKFASRGKSRQSEESPKAPKTVFQKVISSLKDRITELQYASAQKAEKIAQIKHVMDKYKLKDEPPKKVELIKKSGSKKHIFDDVSRGRDSVYGFDFQNKKDSSKSIPKPTSEAGEELNQTYNFLSGADLGQNISKELFALRQSLMEKIRSLEAQNRQNQHRTQNIQKTMDIIERSHEMLKYDFDRTSTSWTKIRTAATQDRFKGSAPTRQGESRTSVKEHYEEKLIELFNQMDVIRREYEEIQNRLGKEEGDETGTPVQGVIGSDGKEKLPPKMINALKVDQTKKQVAMLRRQCSKLREDFEQFAWGVNTTGNPNEVKTILIKPNETKEDWKILTTKIYKLRMELQASLRQMENKIATNNDMVVVMNSLEVGIEECRLLMKRKVEQSDYEKGLKRLEGRLNNFIIQVYEKQGRQNEHEGALTKQPWFCLSCDNELKGQNKHSMNRSPGKEKLLGRKVNPESHMVRRNDNSRLPSVVK